MGVDPPVDGPRKAVVWPSSLWFANGAGMSIASSVAQILEKHVTLEVEGIDRMYLNVTSPACNGNKVWWTSFATIATRRARGGRGFGERPRCPGFLRVARVEELEPPRPNGVHPCRSRCWPGCPCISNPSSVPQFGSSSRGKQNPCMCALGPNCEKILTHRSDLRDHPNPATCDHRKSGQRRHGIAGRPPL